MAKERLKSPRARLFVALDLPDPIREGLVAWQAREITDPALRPIAPQALHVTLCFLSYHPEKVIDRIADVMRSVEPRVTEARFEAEPVAVPRSRPRLFALDAPSEGTVALQAELSERLEAERLFKPEKREFWSHVTVARVRTEKGSRGRGGRGRPRAVEATPGPLPDELRAPFSSPGVTLYRSFLRPSGAEYVPLAALELPPGPSGPGG